MFRLIRRALLVSLAGWALMGCDKSNPIRDLVSASPVDIRPDGELATMFRFGTKSTDLQREEKLREIKGKIVQWTLTVYEVSQNDDKSYRIITGQSPKVKFDLNSAKLALDMKEVGVVATVFPRSDGDKQQILQLTTGASVCLRGRLTGSADLRFLGMEPAILCERGDTGRK